MVKFQESDDILEVGCGSGLFLPYMLSLKKKTENLTLTDLSAKMIKASESRLDLYLSNHRGFNYYDKKIYGNVDSFNEGVYEFSELNVKMMQVNFEDMHHLTDQSFETCFSNMYLQLTLYYEKVRQGVFQCMRVVLKRLIFLL